MSGTARKLPIDKAYHRAAHGQRQVESVEGKTDLVSGGVTKRDRSRLRRAIEFQRGGWNGSPLPCGLDRGCAGTERRIDLRENTEEAIRGESVRGALLLDQAGGGTTWTLPGADWEGVGSNEL